MKGLLTQLLTSSNDKIKNRSENYEKQDDYDPYNFIIPLKCISQQIDQGNQWQENGKQQNKYHEKWYCTK